MFIAPNSNIKIYKNVPLDPTYNNTLYFNNVAEQNAYFHGNQNILKYTLSAQSYQRVVKGSMKVAVQSDNLYDCNYLAFQNVSFGQKWFYAFITNVEYVNNETSEITFEIDVMQSYLFDVTLQECFVEREHTDNDAIGSNLLDEGLDTGEYIINGVETSGFTDLTLVLLSNEWYEDVTPPELPDPKVYYWHSTVANMQSGAVQGSYYYKFNNTPQGVNELNETLKIFSKEGKNDSIFGLFLLPSYFITTNPNTTEPNSAERIYPKKFGSFEGYIPKNNKLYTYPYNFLYVSNMEGNSAVFPYEYFDDPNTFSFKFYGTALPNAEIVAFPVDYKGTNGINKDEVMTISNFPQCSYNVDTYKAWLAQNTGNIAASVVSTAVTAGVGYGIKNASGGFGYKRKKYGGHYTKKYGASLQAKADVGLSIGSNILSLLGQANERAVQPIQTRGTTTSTVFTCAKMLDFQFINKRVRREYAEIIDNYFSLYGYATKRVKIPNRNVRQEWTYVKTVGCNAKGGCPSDDLETIKEIYDSGITFWRNPNHVGNYSLANPIG